MARTREDRSNFLRILAEKPFIYYACKKAGISRATIYRWMKDNPSFAKEVHKVSSEGLANQNDAVEMTLVKKALEGNLPAIKFYLPHNHKKYRPMRPDWPPPAISPEEREMYKKVYEWIRDNKPLPPEKRAEIIAAFKRFGYLDEKGGFTEKGKASLSHLLGDPHKQDRDKK